MQRASKEPTLESLPRRSCGLWCIYLGDLQRRPFRVLVTAWTVVAIPPPEGASRYRVKFWQTMFSLMFHSSFMRDCVSHLSTNNIAFFLSHLRFDSRLGFVSIYV